MNWKLLVSGLAAGALAVGGLAGVAPAASAGLVHPAAGQGRVVRVCDAHPRPGYAACLALAVATGPDGRIAGAARPLAAGFTPADIQKAYDLAGLKSGGRTVAIVDEGGDQDLASDLATFRSTYKLPPCTEASGCLKVMNQNGGKKNLPPPILTWVLEESLDVDMVSAACPDCKIDMVEASVGGYADLEIAEDTAGRQPGVVAISNSYSQGNAPNSPAYDHPGIAVVVASGDHGYEAGTSAFPASDTDTVAVGGTSLVANSSKRGYAESVWGSSSPGEEGTGSGCATMNKRPAWQSTAVTTCKDRAANDIAAVANPLEGGLNVYCYARGGWILVGGTSEATPLIAAVFALSGNTAGYPARNLYAKASQKYLYDITKGANGTCTPKVLCTAGKGWDGPTGNGTPHGVKAF